MKRIVKTCSKHVITALFACVVVLPGYSKDLPELPSMTEEEQEEALAYSLGTHAYSFGFPWVYFSQLRYLWTQTDPGNEMTPQMPVNTFWRSKLLLDASYKNGGSPNNDILYSIAWVDVSEEPVILSHPDINDRYFTFEMASMDSDNFAYVGTRETGPKAGHFAIVGPDWQGQLPEDVQSIPPSRTNTVFINGRVLVNGPEDIENVIAIMQEYRLTPLSQWNSGKPPVVEPREVLVPADRKKDPLADWKTMNAAMTQDPPEARHNTLLGQFATLHIGPGQNVEDASEATQRGLARAARDSFAMFNQVVQNGAGTQVNGWTYPPSELGRAGDSNNFLIRAAVQCLAGIVANDAEEALYINTFTDSTGAVLNGNNKYTFRFEAGDLPPVNDLGFWSMTMYGLDYNFVDNEIDRYSIGNRTPDLVLDEDGGLTLYIQSTRPERDKAANWLPSPAGDKFYLILRTYLPKEPLIAQTWVPPALEKTQ